MTKCNWKSLDRDEPDVARLKGKTNFFLGKTCPGWGFSTVGSLRGFSERKSPAKKEEPGCFFWKNTNLETTIRVPLKVRYRSRYRGGSPGTAPSMSAKKEVLLLIRK